MKRCFGGRLTPPQGLAKAVGIGDPGLPTHNPAPGQSRNMIPTLPPGALVNGPAGARDRDNGGATKPSNNKSKGRTTWSAKSKPSPTGNQVVLSDKSAARVY